ncbi:hypothetical protein D9619_002122 [Psilocybe cf. subviscida]|uniref:Uncharacterized protein n=1 Tax=Psilocybe cf. subviscida TaxID=2480587 RepID=A0A8H5BEY3_9AGAR|nr:hypothetical protein D9619_002122 [Psilocybe cf. subviscida]
MGLIPIHHCLLCSLLAVKMKMIKNTATTMSCRFPIETWGEDSGNEEDGDMANSDSDERERGSRRSESEAQRSEGRETDSEGGEQCDTGDEGNLSDDELGPEDGEGGVADEELLGFAMDYIDGINHNGVKIIALIGSIL